MPSLASPSLGLLASIFAGLPSLGFPSLGFCSPDFCSPDFCFAGFLLARLVCRRASARPTCLALPLGFPSPGFCSSLWLALCWLAFDVLPSLRLCPCWPCLPWLAFCSAGFSWLGSPGLLFASASALRLAAAAVAFFVLANLAGEVAGLAGDAALLLGQPLGVGAAFGLALQRLLQPDQPLDLLDVFLDPLLLALEAVGAVLAHQQFEQRLEIGLHRRLAVDGPLELLLVEQLDERFELRLGQPLFRLLDGPREELGPLGIASALPARPSSA